MPTFVLVTSAGEGLWEEIPGTRRDITANKQGDYVYKITRELQADGIGLCMPQEDKKGPVAHVRSFGETVTLVVGTTVKFLPDGMGS